MAKPMRRYTASETDGEIYSDAEGSWVGHRDALRYASESVSEATAPLVARIAMLEQANESWRKAMPAWQAAGADRDRLRAMVHATLTHNGGPIDSSDTVDGVAYVMVREADFLDLTGAILLSPAPLPKKEG